MKQMLLVLGFVPIALLCAVLPARPEARTAAGAEVRQAFLHYEAPRLIGLKLRENAVVFPYALQRWRTRYMGGEALLRHGAAGWKVVTAGGGAPDADSLVGLGVPRSIAEQLWVMIRLRMPSVTPARAAVLAAALREYDATDQLGYTATMRGNFGAALAQYKRAAALNPDPRACAHARDRAGVQAVNDTQAALAAGSITAAAAPRWFSDRFATLVTRPGFTLCS